MTQPASVPADGNLKAVWVPAIASTAAPTVAEVTAVGAKDLSCYLTAEGYDPTVDEQVITDDRLCSRQSFERPGRYKDSLTLGYVHNPDSPTDNVAYTTLDYLTTGFVVTRWGVPYEGALAAADVVDVYPVQCGIQMKQKPTANSVLTVMQKLFVTGPVQRDVAVVA